MRASEPSARASRTQAPTAAGLDGAPAGGRNHDGRAPATAVPSPAAPAAPRHGGSLGGYEASRRALHDAAAVLVDPGAANPLHAADAAAAAISASLVR